MNSAVLVFPGSNCDRDLAVAIRDVTGKAPAMVAFYRPVLDALWDVFGVDRLIYGSNWPVSNRFASYPTVLGIVREYFSERGKEAGEKYFSRNAQSAYKWVKR